MKHSVKLIMLGCLAFGGCGEQSPQAMPPKSTRASKPIVTKVEEMPSILETALRACVDDPHNAEDQLREVRDEHVSRAEEARLICQLLKMTPDERPDQAEHEWPLHQITAFFQQAESREAIDILKAEGLPLLCQIFDQRAEWDDFRTESDLLFILKILAMYGSELGTEYVLKAARMPFEEDGYLWGIILGRFDEEHPHSLRVMRALSDPLPQQFLAIALLDAANQLALSGTEFTHPFDSDEGVRRLTEWLASRNEDDSSYAVSAAASLPFLENAGTHDLLALALDHTSIDVQMEGAWAAVKMQNPSGEKLLQRWCEDPRYSTRAVNYLEELGLAESVPASAREPDFAAMSEMCSWLGHPNEFGRVPDEIELFDSRILFWPPTNDQRRVWLFKYHYEPNETGEAADVGLGMVGSVTFALFGETTSDLSPLETYALHCCWELSMNDDERAPETRSVENGMRLLKQANPGLQE